MDYMFYDTSSLLLRANDLFTKEEDNRIAISSITLAELENIKTSFHKSPEIKCAARHLLHLLDQHPVEVIIYKENFENYITKKQLPINADTQIIACACYFDILHPDEVIFVTNDLSQKIIANLFFGDDSIISIQEEQDTYCGYKDIVLSDEEMSNFYSNLSYNITDSYINEYIIIRNSANKIIDHLRWDGSSYCSIAFQNFKSKYFGEVKPVKNDIYQAFAVDSLSRNTITMLKGPAGSGKSYLALGFLFNQLEKGRIDKIIIFANPVATKGSARLGLTK